MEDRTNVCYVLSVAVAAATLLAPFRGEAQVANDRKGGIVGTVVDEVGRAVPYVYLFVNGRIAIIANGEGRFRWPDSTSQSSVAIAARRIGYAPLDTTIELARGRGQLLLQMRQLASDLKPVVVTESRSGYDDYLDRAGYYRRLAHRVDGTFLSQHDIEKRSSPTLTGVLRDVNGVRVVSRGGKGGRNDYVLGRGGLCALGLVVDGQRVEINNPPVEAVQPRITSIMGSRPVQAIETKKAPSGAESLDEMVNLSAVAGVEVYPSAASVPNSLQHHVQGCGLVVVWTRFQ